MPTATRLLTLSELHGLYRIASSEAWFDYSGRSRARWMLSRAKVHGKRSLRKAMKFALSNDEAEELRRCNTPHDMTASSHSPVSLLFTKRRVTEPFAMILAK